MNNSPASWTHKIEDPASFVGGWVAVSSQRLLEQEELDFWLHPKSALSAMGSFEGLNPSALRHMFYVMSEFLFCASGVLLSSPTIQPVSLGKNQNVAFIGRYFDPSSSKQIS